MQSRFDWRGAFYGTSIDLTKEQIRSVRQALTDWNCDWSYDTDDGYIIRVEDENCDGVWDMDYDDSDDVDQYFSSEFKRFMDMKFLGRARPKTPVVIGNSTKLPLPGSRP